MQKILKIFDESVQGLSRPYLCEADDGSRYYVKSFQSGRAQLIKEWICGKIAKALNLPIADFSLVEIPEELHEELPKNLQDIGYGIAFGSKAVANCSWFEVGNLSMVPVDLRRRIVAFDWWIKNMDRCNGNPNLLYDSSNGKLVVIDHDSAFDKEFDPITFLADHIFSEDLWPILDDLILQCEFADFLKEGLPAFNDSCGTLPDDWKWNNLEKDTPAIFDLNNAKKIIYRIHERDFWSIR